MNGQKAGNSLGDQNRMARGSSPVRRLRPGWLVFDLAFGFVLPIVCFYFGTVLFGGFRWGGLAGPYRPLVYGMTWLAMLLLGVWLVFRERVGK